MPSKKGLPDRRSTTLNCADAFAGRAVSPFHLCQQLLGTSRGKPNSVAYDRGSDVWLAPSYTASHSQPRTSPMKLIVCGPVRAVGSFKLAPEVGKTVEGRRIRARRIGVHE